MKGWFGEPRAKNFLALRIGKEGIIFLVFRKEGRNMRVLSYGSEEIGHFSPPEILETLWKGFVSKEPIHEIIATFPATQCKAAVLKEQFPPTLFEHIIGRGEASALEREACAQAARTFQKKVWEESGISPNHFGLGRTRVLERRINGYRVPKLEGFRRSQIELTILVVFLLEDAFLPLEHFAKTHRMTDHLRVVHILETLELFSQVEKKEGVFLDVEEEKTKIAVVQNGVLSFADTIPMGSDHFTEFLSEVFGMRSATAQIFQAEYLGDSLSYGTREKLREYLLPEMRKFGTLLKDKLLEARFVLPTSFWIFGRGWMLRDGEETMGKALTNDLPIASASEIEFLLPRHFGSIVTFGGANDPVYTPLCLLTLISTSPK